MLGSALVLSTVVAHFGATARNVTSWERQDVSYRLSVSLALSLNGIPLLILHLNVSLTSIISFHRSLQPHQ